MGSSNNKKAFGGQLLQHTFSAAVKRKGDTALWTLVSETESKLSKLDTASHTSCGNGLRRGKLKRHCCPSLLVIYNE